MNEMMMVIANGIWVTMMTKISAGSMGARLSHRAVARGLGGVIGCEARSAAGADTSHILRRVGRWSGLSRVRPRGGVLRPEAARSLLVLVSDLLGGLLPLLQRLVDGGASGDGGADVLGDARGQVREFRDRHELHAQRRTRLEAGVLGIGRVDRVLGLLVERLGGLLVVGILICRGPFARRHMLPAEFGGHGLLVVLR